MSNTAFYNNIDIQFSMGGCKFHAVNLICSPIKHNIPLHSHGINCYEIHYISEGYGTLNADEQEYAITPNTLFVTGPLACPLTHLNSEKITIYSRLCVIQTQRALHHAEMSVRLFYIF